MIEYHFERMSDKKLEQYNLIIKTHAKLNSIKTGVKVHNDFLP